MKKRAFTLAEVLITLGIIGIIAALIIPAISKVKPDETKAMYLRTQRAVSMAVKSYASSLRPCNNDGCYTNYPLFVDNASELCSHLKDAFNAKLVSETPSSCKNDYTAFNDTNPDWSFVTPEGQKFYVSADKNTDNGTYLAEIVFDINGDKEVNHLYDKTNYPNPDRFRLWVTADGNVSLGDAKGLDYTNKGLNWLKKDDNPDNNNNKPENTKVLKDRQCRAGVENDCPVHSACNSETSECECVEGYEKVNGVCVKKDDGKNPNNGGATPWNGTISLSYPYFSKFTAPSRSWENDIDTQQGKSIQGAIDKAAGIAKNWLDTNVKSKALELVKTNINNVLSNEGIENFDPSTRINGYTLEQHLNAIYLKSVEDTFKAPEESPTGQWYDRTRGARGWSNDRHCHWNQKTVTEKFFTNVDRNVVNTLKAPLQEYVNNYYNNK